MAFSIRLTEQEKKLVGTENPRLHGKGLTANRSDNGVTGSETTD